MKTEFRYEVRPRASHKIRLFYKNVAKRYKHTYDEDDMTRNIFNALFKIQLIEKTLLQRQPTIRRWKEQKWFMAKADKWYYAYTIDRDTITIQDACHAQNMHEDEK